MPDIVPTQDTKAAAPAWSGGCQLKIDQRRLSVGRYQPVGFLGQVVMDDPMAVQAPDQTCCLAKVFWIGRLDIVQVGAGNIASAQTIAFDSQ